MHRLPLIAALLCSALASAADCSLPTTLEQRQFTNLSDPVQVSFAGNQYVQDIRGTGLRIGGSYRYQRLARHVAEIEMTEAHPAGPARYTLLLTCLTDHQGRFIHTQHDGPLAPRQRQKSGRWTLQP